jgi:hypothetical protein
MNPPRVTYPVLAPAPPVPKPGDRPKKLRRITRACDYCHKRSIRCRPSNEDRNSCQNCIDFAVACTYDRPAKKRGTKSGQEKAYQEGSGSLDEKRDAQMLLELTNGIPGHGPFSAEEKGNMEKWRAMMEPNEAKIRGLVDVYFEVVYPM